MYCNNILKFCLNGVNCNCGCRQLSYLNCTDGTTKLIALKEYKENLVTFNFLQHKVVFHYQFLTNPMLKLLIFLFIFCIHSLCICTCFLSLKFKKQQSSFHLYTRSERLLQQQPLPPNLYRPWFFVSLPLSSLGVAAVHASSSPATQHTAAGYTPQLQGNCTL